MKAEGLLLQAGSVSAGYEARRVLCEVSFAVSADDFIILRGPAMWKQESDNADIFLL